VPRYAVIAGVGFVSLAAVSWLFRDGNPFPWAGVMVFGLFLLAVAALMRWR
jgi:hypothetical protein